MVKGPAWLSILLLAGLALTASDRARAEKLPIRSYTTEDGLPSDEVTRVRRDAEGFLWFLSREGIARFDGRVFSPLGPEQGLPSGQVLDFLETRDGQVLVATSQGLYRLDRDSAGGGPRFERVEGEDSELAVWADILYEDRSGRVWCGLNIGLYQLESNRGDWRLRRVDLAPYQSAPIYHVTSLAEESDGSLWIGIRDRGGLLRRFPDGTLEQFDRRNGLPREDIRSLLIDSRGTLWVGTSDGLCTLVEDPRPEEIIVSRCFGEPEGLAGTWIWRIVEDSGGTVWLATGGGLAEYRGVTGEGRRPFRTFGLSNGLPARVIMGLIEDGEGNLWMTTDVGGVAKLARNGLVSYGVEDGLDSSTVAIAEDESGSVCAVTGVGGLAIGCFDGERFRTVRPGVPTGSSGRGWGWGQLHLQDRAGHWWVTTFNGLHRFPRVSSLQELAGVSPERSYTAKEGLLDETVFRLFEDSRGDLWIGTVHGEGLPHLYRWRRATDTVESFGEAQGVPVATPTAFAEDADGTLWVGFFGSGFGRFRDGRFQLLSGMKGMPAGSVEQLLLDSSGRLWVAIPPHGALRIDDPGAERPSARLYSTAEGLASDHVRCLAEGGHGGLYLGTLRGVDRLEPATGHVRHYSTADGLPASHVVVAHADREGGIWFGTSLGMSRLEPRPDRPAEPPLVWIRGLRVAGVDRPLSPLGMRVVPRFRMNPDERQIEIEFTSLSLRTGERLRFQYRLEGGAGGWSEPTADRKITFASLAPGRYRFEVRAINSENLVSPEPAVFSFRILPPFWQRWWFVTLCLAAAAAAFYGAHRVRLRRVVELERVRTRIATDLHDDIGSSLSQVSILSEVVGHQLEGGNSQSARPLLQQIAGTSRELVDSMSDIVWSINPQRDRAADLVQRMRRFASDTLTGKDIRLRFEAPEEGLDRRLDLDLRRQVFLVFKEAVNNAARHSGCRETEIFFGMEGRHLVLELRDDGRGFDRGEPAEGQGLASMRRRAEAMGGSLTVESGPGRGTRIRLRAPLRARSGAETLSGGRSKPT